MMLIYAISAQAGTGSAYTELGASLGHISSGDQYFGLSSGASSTNSGFAGSISLYVPVTPTRLPIHLDLGLQNRMYFLSIDTPQTNLAMLSTNVSARINLLSRFYVGGGYAPITFKSTNGPLGLRNNANVTSYFFEGGAIWRVVPELQIAATFAMEYGMTGSGAQSPSPAREYGLRFRLPLFPYSSKEDASGKFDGFRYPFGFMK